MKAKIEGLDTKRPMIIMVRDENDLPVIPSPYPRPSKVSPAVFNSWRSEYRLSFLDNVEAQKALAKVESINDFDKACIWLDKQ